MSLLARKTRDAYAFLAQNYAPGDEICLFGYALLVFVCAVVADEFLQPVIHQILKVRL
jgi:uncharacterized protein (DUF2235 family)